MTTKPSLRLNRLVIYGNGRAVYDEEFHGGVNIIRGENSSGKSTITDMIFYVLGGENVFWTDEASKCDWVKAEVSISGITLSLRRDISNSSAPPIAVCEGPLSETMTRSDGWSYYGRQRSDSRESFSQFMFRRLGLPETKSSDSQSNITLYQVLRLLYGDQNTDATSIFRRERQMFADRQDVRRSVGEMLLGIDDLQGHELRQQYAANSKNLVRLKAKFDSLAEAALKTDPNFWLSSYSEQIDRVNAEQRALQNEIDRISHKQPASGSRTAEELAKISELEDQIRNLNQSVHNLADEVESLSLNAADSEVFIDSLESNLRELQAANTAQGAIGTVKWRYCPLCLAELNPLSDDTCPLCKAQHHGDTYIAGRMRHEQELSHQINESRKLLEDRNSILSEKNRELALGIQRRSHAIEELRTLVSPSTNVDANVSQMLKKYGYLTRTVEYLTSLASLQSDVKDLEDQVASATAHLAALDSELQRRLHSQQERRLHCEDRIGGLTVSILAEDIVDSNNDTLSNAEGLVFSFEKDFLSVRHGRLSASTQAFLKNSFFLGLLLFWAEDDLCRLPGFFVLDNIEDKGMVPERFRKFHHLLIDRSKQLSRPHQVILTTSYIDEELGNSEYCVGPSYDQPPYTLDLNGEWTR